VITSVTIQISSLIRRLLLVSSRIILILIVNINFIFSGLLCYIFIIIFVGGLIVLLVRVSSIVQQEQGASPSFILLFSLVTFIVIVIFLYNDVILQRDCRETTINLMNFLSLNKKRIVFRLIIILSVCLFVLSKLLLDFKGITRNL